MALVRAGRLAEDAWRPLPEGAVPAAGAWIVPLARWQAEREALLAAGARLGLRLPPDARLEALATDLPRLELLVLEFPKFRDGRGFTLARALREHYGWRGEIRATGHLIPDQYQFATRLGIDTVEIPEGAVLASWQRALARFSVAYQGQSGRLGPLSRRPATATTS